MSFKEKIFPTSNQSTSTLKIFQRFKELMKIDKKKTGNQIEKQSRYMKRELAEGMANRV